MEEIKKVVSMECEDCECPMFRLKQREKRIIAECGSCYKEYVLK